MVAVFKGGQILRKLRFIGLKVDSKYKIYFELFCMCYLEDLGEVLFAHARLEFTFVLVE